ncbi:hypothetical protein A0J61_11090 [Choanephora cucurbitarum]|uniref:Uncharacterized protein n=1 Tax=Choanephora cucurbitarum TaxID=101091 RepID=A0A1C7MVK4_9FUNG|nr:hypothetical protein A0J61_11090 [Choanephora cucurbitarum]
MTPDEEMQQMPAATSDPVDDLQSHLHPFGIYLRFDWTPDLLVQDQFALDRDLFNNEVLLDEARGELIDKYPPIRQLNYQPPLTMPEAKRHILASEICTTDLPNDHSQRFIEIINDIRSLMLNINANVSSSRTEIAFRAINPSFRAPSTSNQNYLMSWEAFQSACRIQADMSDYSYF